MRTTLYGYIEEMDFWKSPVQNKVKKHNHEVIKQLNKADEWPPLSYEMFSITHNSSHEIPRANLEYSGRIIHFGANLKSVEYELDEWIAKYEKLLSELIWLESKVHFQTEYSELQTLSWSVDLNTYKVIHNGEFPENIDKSCWNFESTWKRQT
ncbi:hypothetical protein [uncultured Psychroserpens sp.]|uniref:hypothetical protein n=2 Tax=uncultured Psychroserpens sp. TaxID=255436 RepID=UPI002613B6E7|nr:hypothetical protein [uncultured Psychroserpens sp.]